MGDSSKVAGGLRRMVSREEVLVFLGMTGLAYAYGQADAAGQTYAAGGVGIAVALLGALTTRSSEIRSVFVRPAIPVLAGVLVGWLVPTQPDNLFRVSILVVYWLAGCLARYLRLRQRAAEEMAARAVVDERARIARDLHDVVSHSLGVMVVQTQAAESVMATDPEKARTALESASEVGRQALDEMHRLVGVMRQGDNGVEAQPGLGQLDVLVDQARKAGITVALDVRLGTDPVGPGVDLAAYRIVQEALSNVAKHAPGSHAEVEVHLKAAGLEIEITDDGRSAAIRRGGGYGLAGMRERATVYGGHVEAGPRPEGGFRVRAWLPA
jgi:signal transduction histidine kinase